MKIQSIPQAFAISIDPNAKPAEKGAATKYLKANINEAQNWFNSQSNTEEQKFRTTLDRVVGLVQN